jgi:hypothetical protein
MSSQDVVHLDNSDYEHLDGQPRLAKGIARRSVPFEGSSDHVPHYGPDHRGSKQPSKVVVAPLDIGDDDNKQVKAKPKVIRKGSKNKRRSKNTAPSESTDTTQPTTGPPTLTHKGCRRLPRDVLERKRREEDLSNPTRKISKHPPGPQMRKGSK